MKSPHCLPISTLVTGAIAALAAGTVQAQPEQWRTGRWEGYGGGLIVLSETVDFRGGSSLETDDSFGFVFGFGYNVSQHFLLGGEMSWNTMNYDGTLVSADDPPGTSRRIRGELDVGSIAGIATWHFIDGPITPYVSGLIGWTWVDTDIIDGPPQLGCWWDPWFGQICAPLFKTKSEQSFSYGLGIGMRWDFGYSAFARLGYEQRWLDLDNASGSPKFAGIRIEFGGRF